MRRSVLAFFVVLCSLLSDACFNEISRATAANVLSVNGKVLFRNSGPGDFKPVTRESRIHDGDTVRSFENASVDVELVPGVLARLSTNSEMTVERLALTKDGNETSEDMRSRTARVRLNNGKILILFNQSTTSLSEVSVTAPEVTVKPDSDCLFSVWTDGRTSRVTCAGNKVNASAGVEPPVTVVSGYFVEWPAAVPKPLEAADNATAQIDVTEMIDAGRTLLDEAIRTENRRTF